MNCETVSSPDMPAMIVVCVWLTLAIFGVAAVFTFWEAVGWLERKLEQKKGGPR